MNADRKLLLFVFLLGFVSSSALVQATPARSDDARKIVDPASEVRQWLTSFDRAFERRDVSQLEPFYDKDVTIFEGTVTNTGWADYRDNHIGKELAEMSDVSLSHKEVTAHFLDESRKWAYITSHFSLAMTVKGERINLAGLETLVIRDARPVGWKIVHSHTSAKRAKPESDSKVKK
jgi:ketosteroid isomerase-like protein